MPKAEKFGEMVARVATKHPAHAQAIAAFTKWNGPVATPKPQKFSTTGPVIAKRVKLPLLQGAMNP